MSDWPYWAALALAWVIAAVAIAVIVRRDRHNDKH